MSERDERLVGRILGEKYLVHRALGRGGASVVFEAENVLTRALVALKVILEAGHPLARAALEREARLLSRLTHRHIVEVLEVDHDADGTIYVVQELLEGPTLADVIATRGQIPLDEALDLLLPILAALAHAHEHGVVHGDVKPANIVLHRANGVAIPKLIDFGIARSLGAGAADLGDRVWGTPQYMAPEQVLDPAGVDERADVWGAALSLHEALTGRLPWRVDTVLEVAPSAIAGEGSNAILPGAAPALRAALVAALRARPAERTRSVGDLTSDLETARAAGRATAALQTLPAPPTLRPAHAGPPSTAPAARPVHLALVVTAPDVDPALVQDEISNVAGRRVAVLRMGTYAALSDALQSGEAELAWLPPVACAHVLSAGTARLLATLRRSKPTRSALVARAGLARRIEGLAGARAVWVDPWSAAGYAAPRAMLRRAGVDPARAFAAERFAGSHGAVLAALRAGTADVGGVFSGLLDELRPGELEAAGLVVLAVSEPIAPDAVCASVSASHELVDGLADALLRPGRSAALAAAMGADAFDVPDPEIYTALVAEIGI